jgi:uncharacterized membrane protein
MLCGLGYVLLGIAPFTVGVSALVALAVASARKPAADRLIQSHYAHQIRTFWIGLFLCALWLAAIVTWAWTGVVDFSFLALADAPAFDAAKLTADPVFYLAGLATVLSAIATVSWLIVASVFGLTRLVSGQPAGH